MADVLERLKAALADRYTIERELGSGGMATVYLAEDLKHERQVAVKVLRPELAASLGADRFLREIKITANLNHPHILPLLDSGEADSFLFYVMPYVEGESLRDRLKREKQLPIDDSLKIASEVADALGFAHDHNVIHRDIKPENILLEAKHAVVADFGVARAIEEAGETRLTETGIAIGTPAYLSPEQASGERELDGRSDVYALGCVLYEMLAGEPPFTGPTVESIVHKHLTAEPSAVSSGRPTVPDDVAATVSKALAKAPADRYQTAEELGEALAAEQVSLVTPNGGITPAGTILVDRAVKRRWMVAGGAVAVAAIVAVIAVVAAIPRGSGVALDPERIVVAVFRNETGDPSLDPLGKQAGHGITQGIRGGGGFVRFTPWEVALQSSQYVQGEADAGRVRDVVRALAEETGSGTVISGAYYREGSNVRFQVDVTDATTGNVVGSPEPVLGSQQAPSELVGRLQQRVMGFLAMTFDERFSASATQGGRLPTYEAYRAFDEGMETLVGPYDSRAALPHFLRAFELDSTFLTPLIYASIAALNTARLPLVDSLLQVLEAHADQLSEYDRHWMRSLRAFIDYDHETALRAISSAAQIAPQSRASYLRAFTLQLLNRPREELEVLASIDPNRGGMRGNWLYWLRVIEAHEMLGEHTQALDASRKARDQYPGLYFSYPEVVALVALGRTEDARRLLPEVENFWGHIRLGNGLRSHGQIRMAQEVFDQTVEWVRALPPEEVAQETNRLYLAVALYHAEEWTEAWDVLEALVGEFPDDVDYVGLLGCAAARLGNRERALDISEQLAAMVEHEFQDRRPVWQARIAAVLGERAEAVRLLEETFRQRWLDYGVTVNPNIDFESLRDYPPFQEFLRPKG
jgi:tetratricopeptide (TPR) repeat protein/TolB-like protein